MLRGINVGGKKIVNMEKLRASFDALGFKSVSTYGNSGNVIFETSRDPKNLTEIIEREISREFGFPIATIVRTSEELEEIVGKNPFLREKEVDHSRLHITFLSEQPTKTAIEKLAVLDPEPDRFHVKGREIYIHCPDGYGRTKLSNNTLERLLAVEATTRNWKAVNTLLQMSSL
jgi:uncharacterized protein (DUF1697 family)